MSTTVNEVLSRFYGQPVIAGYTNAGWPVVRSAVDTTIIIEGGIGQQVHPCVERVLNTQAKLYDALSDIEEILAERLEND